MLAGAAGIDVLAPGDPTADESVQARRRAKHFDYYAVCWE